MVTKRAVLADLAVLNIMRHPNPNRNSSRKRGALRGQARTPAQYKVVERVMPVAEVFDDSRSPK